MTKLTAEQRAALQGQPGPIPVEDDQTHQVYFLLDQSTLESLRQTADREAIRQGVVEMEAGRILSLDELDARIRAKLASSRAKCLLGCGDSAGGQ